jgi:hypothetical protein
VEGDELDYTFRFNLHPSLLQLEDLVPRDPGDVSGSSTVHILHFGQVEIESWIVPQAQ